MKISYNWLKNYIDVDLPAEELGKVLTDTGLEVEGIESFETVKGGLEGVVIGKVLTCEKHPNADKLSITTVDIGKGEPVPIVCGAPNVAAGQMVPVATVGTTLYPVGAEDGFTIKKSKIRGEVSEGMICAEDELGLGSDHEGIMVLSSDAKIGVGAADYFEIETDVVFEIGLTPNRIDGGSHFGVARDIAAYLKQHSKSKPLNKPEVEPFTADNHDLDIKLEVMDKQACPRYSAVTLTDLKVGPSPDWLRNRLLSIGQTPINNIVDITNFVLHEVGQPLHAFDADRIKGGKVIVKTMPEGTKLVTLDEKERELTASDLVIADADGGMCIGGVFGGIHSGVTESTTKVFLESAWFDPVYIRKTAKHHGLSTDASFRFERGTDPNGTIYALKRAALLMKEIAGAKIASDIIDFYPDPAEDFHVPVTFANIDRLIGKKIPHDEIVSILESLDIRVENRTEQGMDLYVPPYRVDVQREADIIEEILRIYGYNQVEIDEQVRSTLSYVEKPDKEKVINTVSDYLSANGFFEIKSNSLTRESYYDADDSSVVHIHNPLSQDLSRMRKNLLYGGLEAVGYNINRKRADLKLYEFGNCYFVDHGVQDENPQKKYRETLQLGIFLSGKVREGNWASEAEEASYYHAKAFSDQVLDKLGIGGLHIAEGDDPNYSDVLTYSTNGKEVVRIGRVSDGLLKAFDISQDVFAAEFNWDMVMKLHARSIVRYEPLAKFPEVKRDLSLMLSKDVRFKELQEIAYKAERKLLKQVDLFDVYEGEKIEKGKKSYALSFTLQDEYKTLTDKQIDKVMGNISRAMENQVNAVVRGA